MIPIPISALVVLALVLPAIAADRQVSIRFKAVAGTEELACGRTYSGIGTTKSTISLKDFRFYVHGVHLIDTQGKAVPVELVQDDKWQLDDVALLDFEDATGGCRNGNADRNMQVTGTVPEGAVYRGLRFTLGVPFEKNHTDLTQTPPPLNLTAMFWTWNAGHKFARIEFSSTGVPRGYGMHLGSTRCTPNESKSTVPTSCGAPNRVEVEFAGFDPSKDIVAADLAALFSGSNVDEPGKTAFSGCMSGRSAICGPVFSNLGLPFAGQETGSQKFFRVQRTE